MSNESPTAQSGPSDRAIAQAFREVTGPDGGKIGNDYVVDYMQKRAAEIDKEIPPAGARDAVTDEMVERAFSAIHWMRIATYPQQELRAALEAALTGKAAPDCLGCGCVDDGRCLCERSTPQATQPAAPGAGEGVDDPHEFGVGIEPNPKARYWQERSAFWRGLALKLGYVPESD